MLMNGQMTYFRMADEISRNLVALEERFGGFGQLSRRVGMDE